jgi:hypothetical protein
LSFITPHDFGVKGQDSNVGTFVHLAMCKTGHINAVSESSLKKVSEFEKAKKTWCGIMRIYGKK